MKTSTIFKGILFTGVVALLVVIAFLVGFVVGGYHERTRRFNSESRTIEKLLKANGFEPMETQMYTGDGSAMIFGRLPSQREYDRLRKLIDSALGGSSTSDNRMYGISVDEREPQPAEPNAASPSPTETESRPYD